MRVKLGVSMSLKEIATATSGTLTYNINPKIKYISTDSREAENGDLYIPIKGTYYDGEDFVDEVTKNGCYAISKHNRSAHIIANDCSEALMNLASYYVKKLPYILYKIGITGSVGKSTTKEFLKILLKDFYIVHTSDGNYNNSVGLPMSILSAPKESEVLIMEMGMNHKGEISRLSKCLKPDISVITNIGTSHIGNLGSREAIAEAKMEITDGMDNGKICVPYEEILLKNCKNRITSSIFRSNADYYLESKENAVSIYKRGEKLLEAEFCFSENHLKNCLVSACAAALEVGVPQDYLINGISSISVHNIRQRLIRIGEYIFWNDSYNASLESILASFDSIKNIDTTSHKSLFLGDVLELGHMSENIHRKIGELIPTEIFNHIFLFGNYANFIADGAINKGFSAEKVHINNDLDAPFISAQQIKVFCPPGELILLKGSRGVRVERILEYFKKGEMSD